MVRLFTTTTTAAAAAVSMALALLCCSLCAVEMCHAFSILGTPQAVARPSSRPAAMVVKASSSSSQLKAGAAEQDQPSPSDAADVENTEEEEAADADEDNEQDEAEQEEEEEEDAEIVALKQEIADLESALKAKEREVQYQSERAEEYTKAGYARRVAEMETMRRARSMINSSSREAAVAAVLERFLPVLDDFIELETKYAQDDFGKSFNALGGAMRTALKELGVTEYAVRAGDVVDKQRVIVLQEEYSDDFAKNTIIRPIEVGLELQGNVMRMAECVASLGSEAEAKAAEAEQEETSDDSDDEPADDQEASSDGESEESTPAGE